MDIQKLKTNVAKPLLRKMLTTNFREKNLTVKLIVAENVAVTGSSIDEINGVLLEGSERTTACLPYNFMYHVPASDSQDKIELNEVNENAILQHSSSDLDLSYEGDLQVFNYYSLKMSSEEAFFSMKHSICDKISKLPV